MAEVALVDVSKSYGAVEAVRNLSLSIANGEFVVLLGPTGAGKTTTLRLIAGLERPDRGNVLIQGRIVTEAVPAERDVAFVFQQYSLYPHLSVYDNLAFPLRSPARRMDEQFIRRRIQEVRRVSRTLVTIGACATAGGIQALRNFADVEEFRAIVYAHPAFVETLGTSTPIAAHVPVDFELRGCPISKAQLLETISAFLHGRRPNVSHRSVCSECKERDNVCVTVAHGTPCLGPITHAGCAALCPSYHRGCFGCYGPSDSANVVSLVSRLRDGGMADSDVVRVLRTFNAYADEFRNASVTVAAGAEGP